jgi:hypothetical protein
LTIQTATKTGNYVNHRINYLEVKIIINNLIDRSQNTELTIHVNILDFTTLITTKTQNYSKVSCFQTHAKSTLEANIEMDPDLINNILQGHASF